MPGVLSRYGSKVLTWENDARKLAANPESLFHDPTESIMSDYQNIAFEQRGPIAIVTLNRPDAANGIDLALGRELMQVAIECDENPAIRAVVLTGAGKMFCAGGDLISFNALGERLPLGIKELTTYLHAAISRFARMDAPLITAINGTAAGAGMSLAIASDYAIAAESARFTMAYTAAGLTPDGSASFHLPRLVGLRRAQELMLTNRRLSAQEALEWQLVNRVVADEQVLPEAIALAEQLASGPTLAFGTVKKLLLTSFDESLETQMEREAQGIAAMSRTQDGREGIAAFGARRKPEFQGR
jgi:2-(1,2-epoxy-1,2-dihydrophenyl)acetyl-CoA isomerase